jgi:hypothetical protein
MAYKKYARPQNEETVDMPAAATLEATPPVTASETAETTTEQTAEQIAEQKANTIEFEIDDYEPLITVNLLSIPADVRRRLMYNATRAYILNRLSTAIASARKANAIFDNYDAAVKNDPLQTVVPKPEGERQVVPYAELIERGINALYSGEIGKRGTGAKVAKDPLIAHVTRTVVTKLFNKKHALDPNYKFFNAQAEVGPDGVEYLRKGIAANVAAGADEKQQLAQLEEQYLRPARITLGLEPLSGKLKDMPDLI